MAKLTIVGICLWHVIQLGHAKHCSFILIVLTVGNYLNMTISRKKLEVWILSYKLKQVSPWAFQRE